MIKRIAWLILFLCSAQLASFAADEDLDYTKREEKTVYFVTSFNDNIEWNRRVRSTLLAKLYRSEYMINFRSIHFDHNFSMSPAVRRKIVEAYLDGANELVDVFIATDYNAVETMLSFSSEERSHTPLVFVSEFDNRACSVDSLKDCYGAVGTVSFDEVFLKARELFPNANRCYVWGDKTSLGLAYQLEAHRQLAKYEDEIAISYGVDARDANELLEKAAALPENSFVIFTTWTEDDTHGYHNPSYLYPKLTATAKAPMFAVIDCYVREGFVGGEVVSPKAFGDKAGDLALDVLRGKKIAAGRVDTLETSAVYNRKAFARWNVPLSLIPEDARVVGLPGADPNYFRRVKHGLIGSLIFLLLVIAVGIVLFRRHQYRLNASLFREKLLRQAKDRLRFRSEALSAAVSTLPEAMVAVRHDRKILECNEAFCSWVGMPYNAVVGRELSSVCELSNLDAIWRLFDAHRGDCAKQTSISPAFLIAPGGISRYVQGNAYALGGGESEPSGILFIFYDIIDEMRRENLRNLTIKSFDSFSWFYDISADSFTFGEDIPGHIPTTSLKTSKDIDRCIHPKDRERVREYFHTCLAEGRSEFDIQFRLDLTGREEYKWRECRGIIETSTMTDNRQVTYLYGIYICIEEIKHYEEYFKQVRTVFDVASREAHIGYARYNLRSGEGSASAQWFENNGIPQEAREGYDFRNVYTTTSGRQRDEMMRFYVQAMCRQRSRYQGDTRIVLPDGSVRWTHHNKVVTVNDDDELEMVEINYDITERMQEVVALREAFSDAQVEMQLES